jgi:hypothetical protein
MHHRANLQFAEIVRKKTYQHACIDGAREMVGRPDENSALNKKPCFQAT